MNTTNLFRRSRKYITPDFKKGRLSDLDNNMYRLSQDWKTTGMDDYYTRQYKGQQIMKEKRVKVRG